MNAFARRLLRSAALSAVCALSYTVQAAPSAQPSANLVPLYTFQGGDDGARPYGALVRDKAGNLYGTTNEGGGACNCGTVFKLTAAGQESILHAFVGGNDGAHPFAGLVRDGQGDFYGTTPEGGAYNSGTVFKVTAKGKESIVYSFSGGADGAQPYGALIVGPDGNLYGTTQHGGTHNSGTVFKLTPAGAESVLYAFTGGIDGNTPMAELIRDDAGNLYSTTVYGGTSKAGVVFKLDPAGNETVLHSFKNLQDGAFPESGLILDKVGNLYGTAFLAGPYGSGNVFRITVSGKEKVLHLFSMPTDGNGPMARLVRGQDGALYGTTYYGGVSNSGSVFRLAPDGTEIVLHSFTMAEDGAYPYAGLIRDKQGNFYGTAEAGGEPRLGVVFKISNQ
ncbi:MAG TPA: choice-of-anchor tandem repeat GloVer-containing protein [Rhizomicrobium sp.]|nr:choice-of-anchor tandem repeat GloVer-containing protein [Rhizomicrobium sp.]